MAYMCGTCKALIDHVPEACPCCGTSFLREKKGDKVSGCMCMSMPPGKLCAWCLTKFDMQHGRRPTEEEEQQERAELGAALEKIKGLSSEIDLLRRGRAMSDSSLLQELYVWASHACVWTEEDRKLMDRVSGALALVENHPKLVNDLEEASLLHEVLVALLALIDSKPMVRLVLERSDEYRRAKEAVR